MEKLGEPLAFISGASGGLGGAIAERLAKAGYSLVLHYNKNEQNVKDLSQDLFTRFDCNSVVFQADFSNPRETLEKLALCNWNPHVVVHNSGTSKVGLMTDLSEAEVMQELTVGITTPFLITQAFIPEMVRKKHGKIVVITSIWGSTGASCEVLYSTIKGGLNTFVKSLAKEVAPSNIQVNGVAPGAMDTKMLDHFSEDDLLELAQEIPAGRLGSPKDVASAVAFLVAEENSYVNGHILSVNGAWHC